MDTGGIVHTADMVQTADIVHTGCIKIVINTVDCEPLS